MVASTRLHRLSQMALLPYSKYAMALRVAKESKVSEDHRVFRASKVRQGQEVCKVSEDFRVSKVSEVLKGIQVALAHKD